MAPGHADAARRIIAASSRERPADRVLRETLRDDRLLTPADRAEISRLVLLWFRWRGWLECPTPAPTASLLGAAEALAVRFATKPESFADADLVRHAVPGWLREEMEVPPAFARALQAEPRLWLRSKRDQGARLAADLRDCHPLAGRPDTLEYRGTQDLFRTPWFHEGAFEVQDLGSQAVGWICDPRAGQTWWDVCAGEGGKLLHLAELMANKGLIWASDRAQWRLKALKRRTARARVFNYRAVPWDGGEKPPTRTRFDGVLVDAPCSGVGTWQRNPHARWTTLPSDVSELAEVQRRLLRTAGGSLKPGGKLVYAVCTVTRQETSGVADALEAECPALRPLPFANPLNPSAEPAARLLLWPQDHFCNGMFIAAWTLPAA